MELWEAEGGNAGRFGAATERMTFARGEGLPGRVWDSGEPAWIPDLAATPTSREATPRPAGLCAAFCFPITIGGRS